MAVTFDLPQSVEESLALELGNVNAALKEAALVELYRHHQITHRELGEALGLSRLEVEDVLKKHNVTEDLPTLEEHRAMMAHLRAMKLP